MHGENLTRILPQVPPEEILPVYRPNTDTIDPERLRHRASEMFFRDRIALSVGLQQLDLFLSRILNTLYQQSTKLPKDNLHQLLLYDPHNAITSIANVPGRIRGIVYLGNKGLNMVKMQDLGLPVPHGLIITTEVFRCREIIDGYPPAEQNLREQIAKHIRRLETVSNKRIGDNRRPLLLSVRSGSAISQPGMMDTFLDVGINEEIAANIAANTNNAWFAWDSYRRFLQCVGMAHDLERDDFDAIISEMKRRIGIQYKRDFTGAQMHKVAMVYKTLVCDHGITIWENPFDQLYATIKYVFDSWDSSKARTYRHIMGISDDWGTAVTIQEMVYGNLSHQSGSGVFFTHNPRWSVDSLSLWGDFTVGNQGEDVVSGLVTTLPISIAQQDTEMRETDVTLETAFPAIYRELHRWALELIEKHGFSPQELEFTFESARSEDLYLLQTRDMTIRERKQVRTFDATELSRVPLLGHGLGVSGGAMSGRLVFTLDEIDHWRNAEPDTALILARADTVPDDIQEIFAADGLVTARGGVTSHAAVVTYRLGKTGVVGCGNLVCDERHKTCRFAETTLTSGDYISIDGRQGAIYLGQMLVKAH
jgi:pyruvate,orthophosphate dikinase